jgi:OOP family OmpA-OmpF porin
MNKFLLHPIRTPAVLLATIGISFAAVANDGPYLNFQAGGNWVPDQNLRDAPVNSRYNLKPGVIGSTGIGYSYRNGLRTEVGLDYRRNEFDSRNTGGVVNNNVSGNENVYSILGSLYYDVKAPSGFFNVVHPYIGLGAGTARVEMRNPPTAAGAQGPSSFKALFAYQAGTGIGVDISPQVTLTADYRYMGTQKGNFNDNGTNVKADYRSHSALVGLRYFFYTPPARMIKVSEPVEAAAPPPPPPPVVRTPAPLDSDGDGVPDDFDKCANTPHGFRVDADGCIIEQTTILRTINFVFNSDRLTAPAQDTLNGVAAALIGQPSLDVQIAGYTDSIGSEKYNHKLSHERATSVRTYLISKGVTAENLKAQGYGESNPVASNDTPEGRAENRRVEFIVLNKPAHVNVKSGEPTEASKDAAESGEPARLTTKKVHKKRK